MIIRKCDFCGAGGAEEIKLPQPNMLVAETQNRVIARYKQPGVYYKDFDLCPECQDKIFNFMKQLQKIKRD